MKKKPYRNISTADNTGFSPRAPWHRHRTGNARQQSAWLPYGYKSSDGLLWGNERLGHLWYLLPRCMTQPIALSYWLIFHLNHRRPLAPVTGGLMSTRDEPTLQSQTQSTAMETQSQAAR